MPVFDKGWRKQIWSQLETEWDIIIVGGGITGAGILYEATKLGYKALLVEQHDFASGTSSRSSKLVHGGFRYLKNGQLKITMDSVREREKLLEEGKGLIYPLKFLFANKRGDSPPGFMFGIGLILYGLMAGKWIHAHYSAEEIRKMCNLLNIPDLVGGYGYYDAQTDDARLTLRVIFDAVRLGGTALNYTCAIKLLKTQNGQVCGVTIEDRSNEVGLSKEVLSKTVINATGPWADELRGQINRPKRIRPLRGSHLAFAQTDLPLDCAVSLLHPRDNRSVFIFPWQGITIVGTTDIDTRGKLPKDPKISQGETEYLFELVHHTFPGLELGEDKVISTWAGIRPVINTGKKDPSKESREHVIWEEDGLITITGGKLTTFRVMAHQVLKLANRTIGAGKKIQKNTPILNQVNIMENSQLNTLGRAQAILLAGRYGNDAFQLVQGAKPNDMERVASSDRLWAEIRWAVKNEAVVHLDDLMLRRIRIGLLARDGGKGIFPRLKGIMMQESGWDDSRWEKEKACYLSLHKEVYKLTH